MTGRRNQKSITGNQQKANENSAIAPMVEREIEMQLFSAGLLGDFRVTVRAFQILKFDIFWNVAGRQNFLDVESRSGADWRASGFGAAAALRR